MGPPDLAVVETSSTSAMTDQPFTKTEMGNSMDTDLLLEMSSETRVATVHLDEATSDLTPPDSDPDLIASSLANKTLTVVRDWVRAGTPPTWSEYTSTSPELRSWHLQFGNLSLDSSGLLWHCRTPPVTSLQLVVPPGERRVFIQHYHDSVFAGNLSVSRTVCCLLDHAYWPGLREDVRSYLASCSVCLARKSPCPRWSPMGHVLVGHRWDIIAMDILDMSVTTERGHRYVLVIVDCFYRWTKACPLPNKMAVAVANTFFHLIICRFGMRI